MHREETFKGRERGVGKTTPIFKFDKEHE